MSDQNTQSPEARVPLGGARVVNGYTIAPWANLSGSDLSGANLSGANLSGANLRGSDLRGAILSGANLSGANLSGANLRGTNLSGANLSGANLSGANLSGANLSECDLRGAILSGANLSGANLSGANLSECDLSGTNLSRANLSGTNLSGTNLSGTIGLLSPIDWLAEHLERTGDGYIAYKQFGLRRHPPTSWQIEAGSGISEVVNPDRTTDCACGVNVAQREWFAANGNPNLDLWRVLIRWEWLPGVIVPYHTGGKIRCERVELVEQVANWQEAVQP